MNDEKYLENESEDLDVDYEHWPTLTPEESKLVKKLHAMARDLELIKRQAPDIH